ncbi:MAG: hypothetical protein C4589_11960 [Peptococcaceae bacterium]|nr:MAG: hypothetical protein C4589_11960 [Peptococcaceae bacterium]
MLNGKSSIRINHQHRLVYFACKGRKTVKIISMWEHYE